MKATETLTALLSELEGRQDIDDIVRGLDEAQKAIILKIIHEAAEEFAEGGKFIQRWERIQHKIPTGYSVRYSRQSENEPEPFVELLTPKGETEMLWKPARLFAVRKARPAKHEWNDSAIISVLREREVAKDLVAGLIAEQLPGVDFLKAKDVFMMGRHLITLAKLSGAPAIHDWTCQKIGELLGITKQAVSRRNRRMNDKIQASTGGKTSFRCVRTKPDPRKGKPALPSKKGDLQRVEKNPL